MFLVEGQDTDLNAGMLRYTGQHRKQSLQPAITGTYAQTVQSPMLSFNQNRAQFSPESNTANLLCQASVSQRCPYTPNLGLDIASQLPAPSGLSPYEIGTHSLAMQSAGSQPHLSRVQNQQYNHWIVCDAGSRRDTDSKEWDSCSRSPNATCPHPAISPTHHPDTPTLHSSVCLPDDPASRCRLYQSRVGPGVATTGASAAPAESRPALPSGLHQHSGLTPGPPVSSYSVSQRQPVDGASAQAERPFPSKPSVSGSCQVEVDEDPAFEKQKNPGKFFRTGKVGFCRVPANVLLQSS